MSLYVSVVTFLHCLLIQLIEPAVFICISPANLFKTSCKWMERAFAFVSGSFKNCLYRAPVNIASHRGLLMTAIITGWGEQQLRERGCMWRCLCYTLSKPVWMHSVSPTIIQYIARHRSDEPPRSGLTTMSSAGRLGLKEWDMM